LSDSVPPLLDRLDNGARVAVIRLRSLGDSVLTTPALTLLHQHRPDLEIGVAVEERFAEVFRNHPAVSKIIPPAKLAARAFAPQLCLNLHGGTRSVWMTALSGARWRAGFGHHAHAWVYNQRVPRAQQILGVERTVHTAEHLASAMFWLGVPAREIPRASLYAEPARRTRPYAVIHALASAPEKMWPAANFLAVARHLQERLEPVFIGGPGEDLSAFAEFTTAAGNSLAETKSLLAGASFFVGNDSGPAHMAAAFGLPAVVLYGTSDPVVWAPWRTAARTFVSPQGLARIATDQVIEAIDGLLATGVSVA
jgi:heptosyltransferase III